MGVEYRKRVGDHCPPAFVMAAAISLVMLTSIAAFAQEPKLKTTLDLTLPGIQPLDADSVVSASVYGERNGAPPPNDPIRMCEAEYRNMDKRRMTVEDSARFARLMGKTPFSFQVWSPYAVVASLAADAKRRFESRPAVNIEDYNGRQVVVHVGPSETFADADAIENVVIQRGTDVIRPLSRRLTPVQIKNGFSAARSVAEGDFTFPLAAFEPSSAITVVMVGNTGNFQWLLTPSELARLK